MARLQRNRPRSKRQNVIPAECENARGGQRDSCYDAGKVSQKRPDVVGPTEVENRMFFVSPKSLVLGGWRQQAVDFATGRETRLIAVRVMRVAGNPLIKGTFWLDDVQLAAVSTAEGNH